MAYLKYCCFLLPLFFLCGCPPPYDAKIETSVLDLVNAERERVGLPVLSRNRELDKVARAHSWDMQKREILNHRGRDGSLVEARLDKAGVAWIEVGENLARNRGFSNPAAEAMQGWIASPEHLRNIHSSIYWSTGIGVLYSPKSKYYYITQVFVRHQAE